MKEIMKYLIDEIVDLKIDLNYLRKEKNKFDSEINASKQIICDLKLQITNLKLFIETKQ